jgi:hypothetical protein
VRARARARGRARARLTNAGSNSTQQRLREVSARSGCGFDSAARARYADKPLAPRRVATKMLAREQSMAVRTAGYCQAVMRLVPNPAPVL